MTNQSAIHNFGLKVSLTVTKPQLTAKDDKATGDAESANNAHGAGQYRKDLYPKHLIAPILEVESAARAFMAKHLIEAVLPASKIIWFSDQMNTFKVRFDQAVTVFMQNISNVIAAAKESQGNLFDAGLYPDTSQLRARFTWDVQYDTVSDTSKFAAIMGVMDEASKAHLTNAISSQIQREQTALVSEALERMQKVVAHLASATARPDRAVVRKDGGIDVRPPIFKASMVDNIKELADMLETYASALPPDVIALKDKAVALATHNSETLKNDPDLRKQTQQAAAALTLEINQMLGYEDEPLPTADTAISAAAVDLAQVAFQMDDDDMGINIPVPQAAPVVTGPKEYTTGGDIDFSELEDF